MGVKPVPYYIATTEGSFQAKTAEEVFSILHSIDTDTVISIEHFTNRWGWTDVSLKFLTN